MNSESIHKDTAIDYGYEGATSKKAEFRISDLPEEIQASARGRDKDGDGALDTQDVGAALVDLSQTKKDNRSLKKTIAAFVLFSAILIACIFAATITAARLSKDINVSSDNGVAYAKGSSQVMKTAQALVEIKGANIVSFTNAQLQLLSQVTFVAGAIKFDVKGYARRDPTIIDDSGKIILLVEGGTITFGDTGVIASTGNAQALLEFAFGPDDDKRRLSQYAAVRTVPNENCLQAKQHDDDTICADAANTI